VATLLAPVLATFARPDELGSAALVSDSRAQPGGVGPPCRCATRLVSAVWVCRGGEGRGCSALAHEQFGGALAVSWDPANTAVSAKGRRLRDWRHTGTS
jgi:hypothetical protein